MAFKFWGDQQAQEEFKADFMSVHRAWGCTGCYAAAETERQWSALRVFFKRSQTAMQLLDFVESSPTVIHVVGMSGGFQCFGSTQGQDNKKGTIFVDLDAKLNIRAHTAHNLHLPISRMATIWSGSKDGITTTELDNRVALIHEVGHAKQWIQKPGWFDNDYRTQTKVGLGENAQQMKDVTAEEIRKKARGMALRTAARTYEAGRQADLSFLPPDERSMSETHAARQKLTAPVGWGVPIEHDNMRVHEWPICREMGLALRSNYGDISDGGSVKNKELTNMMKFWGQQEEAARDARDKAATRMAKVDCPRCGKKVNAKNLDKECGTFLHA